MFYGDNNKEKQKHIVLSFPCVFSQEKNDSRAVLLIFIPFIQNASATTRFWPPIISRTSTNA